MPAIGPPAAVESAPQPTPPTSAAMRGATAAVKSHANPAPAREAQPDVTPFAAPVVTGNVQLAISPWGEVEVDGSAAGTTPPLARLTLPEGTHTITVRNDDALPHTVTVQVSADKPVTVRHRFGS